MVLQFIPTAVRIGQIVYRAATVGGKYLPKTSKVLKQQGAYEGAQIGAGLGSFVANVEYYFEQEGRLDGIPTRKVQQRQYNRFKKTRNQVFKSFRGRCRPTYRNYRRR